VLLLLQVASADDFGPVANSPQSEAADAAVIEAEVDVASLAAGMQADAADAPADTQQQQPKQPPPKQPAQQQSQRSEQQQEQ
jgi:hypothetical protein